MEDDWPTSEPWYVYLIFNESFDLSKAEYLRLVLYKTDESSNDVILRDVFYSADERLNKLEMNLRGFEPGDYRIAVGYISPGDEYYVFTRASRSFSLSSTP